MLTTEAEYQAPFSQADAMQFPPGKLSWTQGYEPVPRTMPPGYDAGVGCLLIVLFLLLAFNFNHYTTFIKTFAQDLWRVRDKNVFDKVLTLNETRIQGSLILLLCLCEGLLLWQITDFEVVDTVLSILVISGVCFIYLLLQRVAYAVMGRIFATDAVTVQLLRGFTASQCLLGLALIFPVLISLFYPGDTMVIIWVAAGMYLIARLIFISKGFRLFYDGIGSTCYFILYLCTLEIAPLFAIAKGYDLMQNI